MVPIYCNICGNMLGAIDSDDTSIVAYCLECLGEITPEEE